MAGYGRLALIWCMGASLLQSCEQDILVGQPDWLGNSIYERLQGEGNYTQTLRLIDDLGQTAVLSETGSKTLFVADDDAFNAFFADNAWGVKKYEDLTLAQKKLMLNSAMINNAYLVELLSNTSGNPPMEGKCMRRATAVSVYDSVPRIYGADMPNTVYWDKYRNRPEGMLLVRDNSTKPMIHFLPAYMKLNNITDDDLRILTNGVSSTTSDAWVNGMKIDERDIACKNGYIHKVSGVMTSADNMSEIIASNSRMSQFHQLLGRFCAPYYDANTTHEYDRLYNSQDSVFVLKYFATSSTVTDVTDPDGNPVDAELLYDPAWNQYTYITDSDEGMQQDAGAMLVPSNEALEAYWNGEGQPLQNMYKSWDKVPLKVLVKLVNINMISSFMETVPSKFENIVDPTTKVSIGIQPGDVDACYMGCNGVVYLINKVFAPADYSSVSFPALVNENTMNIIYWGISNLDFEPYLNSMDSKYSFFIPTNNALTAYIDPCSYGSSQTVMYQFYFDKDTKSVKAHRYTCNLEDDPIRPLEQLEDATDDQVRNRLTDILDNLIVVGNVEDGNTYYKTKGGAMLKVAHAGSEGSMSVNGGLQIAQGRDVVVDTIYGMVNGKSYIVNKSLPMSAPKSVYATLREQPEYAEFFTLLNGSSLLAQRLNSNSRFTCADWNISLFDVYNYTVYVPTNQVLKDLHDEGLLPSWEDYDGLTPVTDDEGKIVSDPWGFGNEDGTGYDRTLLTKARTLLSDRINNFLRYHIQDNSVALGGAPQANVKYETFKINPLTKRFYSVTVNTDADGLKVTDQMDNSCHVVKTEGLYNNLCRDIWVENASTAPQIYSASDVVVHSIDGALFYGEEQMTRWEDEVRSLINKSKNK